jgi:hypothetical protein
MSTESLIPTKTQIFEFLHRLDDEAQYDEDEGRWTFRSGGDCCNCTSCAEKVAVAFNGEVWGYVKTRNPSSLVATGLSGHDFALISGRFLVDVLAFNVSHETDRPVFDLDDPVERTLVSMLYGERSKWEKSIDAVP